MKKVIAIILSFILVMAVALDSMAFSSIAVKGIKLDKSSITMNIGQTYKLKVTLTPANTTQKLVTYATDNNKIATVDKNGSIIGIGAGTTTITVYAQNKKLFAKCKVTITQLKKTNVTWMTSESAVTLKEDWLIFKELTKKTGTVIKLIKVPLAQYTDKLNVTLAGGDLPDVIKTDLANANKYGELGAFINFKAYAGKMPNFVKYTSKIEGYNKLVTASNGKQYCAVTTTTYTWMPFSLILRKDLYDKSKVALPKTWDDLYNGLVKIKADNPNMYPWVNRWGMTQLLSTVATAWNVGYKMSFNSQTRKWYISEYSSHYEDFLKYFNKLYNNKLLDPEFATTTTPQGEEKYLTGKGAIASAYMAEADSNNNKAKDSGTGYEWVATPFPASPYDGKTRANAIGQLDTQGVAVSAKSKVIDAAIRAIDYIHSDEGIELFNWGVQGITFTKNSKGEREFVDEIKTVAKPTGTIDRRVTYGLNENQFFLIKLYDMTLNDVGPNYKNTQAEYKNRKAVSEFPAPSLVFSGDDNDFIANWLVKFNATTDEYEMKFITGQLSFDKWTDYINVLKDMGTDKALDIYNKVQKEYDK